jgi:autotransporter-associated beta strand protein
MAAAGSALAVALLATTSLGQTWVAPISGNWSNTANWSGGVLPSSGIDTTLNFRNLYGAGAITVTNDFGPFTANSLVLENQAGGGTFAITPSAAANTLTLATSSGNVLPTIVHNSGRTVSFAASGTTPNLILANQTTITGSGTGLLSIDANVGGTGGLVINQTGGGRIALNSNNNNFTGGVRLVSGVLQLGAANALGDASNTLTIDGGLLQWGTATTEAHNIQLNQDLVIGGTTAFTNLDGVLSDGMNGAKGIRIGTISSSSLGSATTMAFRNTSGFSGAVTIDPMSSGGDDIRLASNTTAATDGRWTNVSSVTAYGVSGINLDNTAANNNNRINDSAAINLNRSNFTISGNSSAATAETLGALTFSGQASFNLNPNAASPLSVTFASSTRASRGTMTFTGSNFGQAPGNGAGNIYFTSAPTADLIGGGGGANSQNISVLPYAIATNTAATAQFTSLATYDASGVRPLTAAEFRSDLYNTRDTSSNVNARTITSTAGINAGSQGDTTTYNALVINSVSSGSSPGYFTGSGKLALTSGELVFGLSGSATPGATTVPSMLAVNELKFGAAEGVIHTVNSGVITGTISGTGGITKSGPTALMLSGNNTFSGTVTVGGGNLLFSRDANLGNASNGIRLETGAGGALAFVPYSNVSYAQTIADTFSGSLGRSIELAGAGGQLMCNGQTSSLAVSSNISGAGELLIGQAGLTSNISSGLSFYNVNSGSGTVVLSGNNTYTGRTILDGGVIAVSSDANLGSGGDLVFGGLAFPSAALRIDGDLATSRRIHATSGANIWLNGGNFTYNGVAGDHLGSDIAFLFFGSGTATFTQPQLIASFTIGTTSLFGSQHNAVTGSTVILKDNAALATVSGAYTVNAGGELRLDNSGTNLTNRLATNNVVLGGGAFSMIGNAAAASEERIGTLNPSDSGSNAGLARVNLQSTGTQGVLLGATSFTRTGGAGVLVTGGGLDGTYGANTATLSFNAAPTLTGNIIPGVIGQPTGGIVGFMTSGTADTAHQVGGVSSTPIRMLTAGEYTSNSLGGGASSNADITAPTSLGVSASVNAARIQGGGGVTIGAGQTLTLGTGHIITTNGANSGIQSDGLGNATLSFGAANAFVYTGQDLAIGSTSANGGVTIAGTGGMLKAGPGTLTINSPATLTNTVVTAEGTLKYGVANALGVTTPQTIGVGATVDTSVGASTVATLNGYGRLYFGASPVTVTSANFLGSFEGSGPLTLSGGATIAGTSPNFTGTTTLVGVSGANFFVNSGPGALGTGTGSNNLVTINGVNSLILGSNVTEFDRNIDILDTGGAAFVVAAGTLGNFSGNITLHGRGLRMGSNSTASMMITGNILEEAGHPSDVALGFGNGALWGNNTFSGNMLMTGQANTVLGVGSDTALGTSTIVYGTAGGGSFLRADRGARTLSNNISLTVAAPSIGTVGSSDLTLNGNVSLPAGGTPNFKIFNTGLTSINGVISGAATSFTKSGGGALALGGANTYGGTTIVAQGELIISVGGSHATNGNYTVSDGGLLRVNGSITIASGTPTLAVSGAGVLAGSGSIALPTSLSAGAIIDPGNSAGTLTTGDITMLAGSMMNMELGTAGVVGGGVNDLIASTGSLSLPTTGTVVVNLLPLPGFLSTGSETYTLMTYNGTTPATGSAASFSLGSAPGNVTSVTFDTTSVPGSVLITVVPAPTGLALLGVAGILAPTRRRRR